MSALLRRPRAAGAGQDPAPAVRRCGDLELDPRASCVTLSGVELELTPIEFRILDALTEHPNATLSRQQLLDHVWGPSWFGDDHVVDVHVSNLRKKLGDDPRSPQYVRTVRGFGYRLGAP